MTFHDWREPASLLRRGAGPAASHQIELAERIGCQIDSAAPFSVVAARLEAFLGPRVRGAANNPLPPTEAQVRYLTALSPSFTLSGESRPEISAWIDHFLSLATADALEKLALNRGDAVRVRYQLDIQESPFYSSGVVSSIGSQGLVYFKGGNGKCAWPRSIEHSLPPS
ncbi:hypothetical protein AB0230_08800 [Microbacterium sp. NPDC089190]|uniref:hypothetical protein n=1 Tax=Microbacterium sp. NPDC089190 TaxID=3155063 RepID=UPI00344F2755